MSPTLSIYTLCMPSLIEIHELYPYYFQCYYIGGLKTSATYILGTMSKPLMSFMPSTKICEKLRDADSQICDLKYGKSFFDCLACNYH